MAGTALDVTFTRIANEILEEVAKRRFNGTQFRIIMIVWRYTYGFNRKSHELSVGFLAEAIQSGQRGVKAELNKLIEQRVLKVTQVAHGNRPRKIGFNKYFSQWVEGANPTPSDSESCGGQLPPALGVDSTPCLGANSSPKKERKKTLKKEEIKDMDIPSEKIKFHDTVFLTQEQYEKLCEDFGKTTVDDTIEALDEWQSNKKPSQHKKDHNKTLRVWIKKDRKKPTFKTKEQKKLEEMELLKQFSQGGGMPHEQSGDLQLTSGNQNGVS